MHESFGGVCTSCGQFEGSVPLVLSFEVSFDHGFGPRLRGMVASFSHQVRLFLLPSHRHFLSHVRRTCERGDACHGGALAPTDVGPCVSFGCDTTLPLSQPGSTTSEPVSPSGRGKEGRGVRVRVRVRRRGPSPSRPGWGGGDVLQGRWDGSNVNVEGIDTTRRDLHQPNETVPPFSIPFWWWEHDLRWMANGSDRKGGGGWSVHLDAPRALSRKHNGRDTRPVHVCVGGRTRDGRLSFRPLLQVDERNVREQRRIRA